MDFRLFLLALFIFAPLQQSLADERGSKVDEINKAHEEKLAEEEAKRQAIIDQQEAQQDLEEEAQEQAMLGQLAGMVATGAAMYFANCAMSCSGGTGGSESAPDGGLSENFSSNPTLVSGAFGPRLYQPIKNFFTNKHQSLLQNFSLPPHLTIMTRLCQPQKAEAMGCMGKEPKTCRLINWPLAVVSAAAAWDSFRKAYTTDNARNDIRDPNAPQQNPLTLPEGCEGNLCETLFQVATTDSETLDTAKLPNVCLDQNNKDACISFNKDGEPEKVKVGDETLTMEEVEALAQRASSQPGYKTAKAGAQKMGEDFAKNSGLGDKLAGLEKKKGKSKKPVADSYITGTGSLSDSSTKGRNSYSPSGQGDPLDKQFAELMAQFKKKKERTPAQANPRIGKDEVGPIQDNIFAIAHRRYQKLRAKEEFIEPEIPIKKRS